jgi:nucleotide-binding universal stress UspA family protein
MSDHRPFPIVAAIDFSELGDRAVLEALRLSQQHPHAELHVLTVGSDDGGAIRLPGSTLRILPQEEAEVETRGHVADLVQRYTSTHGAIGVERIAVYTTTGYPAERIVALATAIDADVIVLGTHGRTGLKRIVLGSVAEEVVRRAPCTVHVIRPRDFLDGEKVPAVQPPLKPGEHALRNFEHRPTYHYVRPNYSNSMMPVQ